MRASAFLIVVLLSSTAVNYGRIGFDATARDYVQGVEAITTNQIYLSGRYSGQLTAGSQNSTASGTFDLFLVEVGLN